MKISKRKIIVLGLAGIIAAGAYAFAASLTVTSTSLGAGDQTVASCDTSGVNTAYTSSYDATMTTFKVTAVNLSNIDLTSCDGKALTVVLTDTANSVLAQHTAAHVSGATQSVDFSGDSVRASDVVGVHVQLNG